MNNEELAAHAKAGDREALYKLWVSVRRLAFKIAHRYIPMLTRAGYTEDDLEQELFLASCAALDAFDPAGETLFTSYLQYPIQNAMRAVLGIRSGKDLPPIPVSLDEPINAEGAETTRGELLPDPDAGQPFEDVEHRLYIEQLRNALNSCIASIGDRPAAALRARYFEGKTLEQTSEQLGVSREQARAISLQGLRQMRRSDNKRRLEQFRENIISTRSYHGTGWNAWKNGGSVQERIVEYLEDREVRLCQNA